MKYIIKSQVLYTLEMECESSSYEEAVNYASDKVSFDVKKEPWKIEFINVTCEPILKQ
jgi:hypothetical protein